MIRVIGWKILGEQDLQTIQVYSSPQEIDLSMSIISLDVY